MKKDLLDFRDRHGDLITPDLDKDFTKYTRVAQQLDTFEVQNAKTLKVSVTGATKRCINRFKNKILFKKRKNLTDYQAFLANLGGIPQNLPVWSFINIPPKPSLPASDQQLDQVNFPILSLTIGELAALSTSVLMKNSFTKDNCPPQMIQKLVNLIAQNYLSVSYHNYSHAFSLLFLINLCWNRSPTMRNLYSPMELTIILIAALSHDLSHPGHNSTLEIKRNTLNAVQFSYQSVLENMHLSVFQNILRENPDVDIFQSIKDPSLRQRARKLLCRLIIATDITFHHPNLMLMKSAMDEGPNFSQYNHREIILENFFHSCDIGNPCLSYDNYINWSSLLSYEFDNQALSEAQEGFEVSPFIKFTDLNGFYKGQIGFVEFVVLPTWKELVVLWPEISELLTNILNNIQKLKSNIQK